MHTATPLLALLGTLAMPAWASESANLVREIHDEFRMGLFARQDVGTLQEGPDNLNTFTGNLGVNALAITSSGDDDKPYEVDGETVSSYGDAVNKACDGQSNQCAQQANGAQKGNFEVNDCDKQKESCHSVLDSATQTAFLSIQSENADFQFFCEN
ncbi:hypothetical protein F5Y15DRAFT_232803 [Xylariaceae sp. FL0016]|nr:hypothetical protein F5Y15DRAFT_232803 [Xylariaceae sp. FL0016]